MPSVPRLLPHTSIIILHISNFREYLLFSSQYTRQRVRMTILYKIIQIYRKFWGIIGQ